MRPIFVAGTDTGVGKTLISGAIAAALREKGLDVGVMKPVSCGGQEDARFLIKCAGSNDPMTLVNPIALNAPLSPNVAAKLERKKLRVGAIFEALAELKRRHDVVVIEGCGGLLVPLDDRTLFADLVRRFGAKTVLVSRSGLGAINHSLLSLEALRSRGLRAEGIVFNRLGGGTMTTAEKTNPAVVSKTGRVRSLGVFPFTRSRKPVELARIVRKQLDLTSLL